MSANNGQLNPYSPPVVGEIADAEPTNGRRSGVPLVCGILSIVIGGLLSLCFLFVSIYERTPPEDGPWPASLILIAVAMLSLSPALLFVGVGQARYRRWVAKDTLIWATLAWIATIGFALLMLLEPSDDPSPPVATALSFVFCLGLYPTVLLALFFKRGVRASLVR
jgi:hypothetical protein